MDKCKCRECGEVFFKEDAGEVRDLVGEFWGAPAYITYLTCPVCRSTDTEEYEEPEEDEENEDDE